MQLSYNWHFEVGNKDDEKEAAKLFSVPGKYRPETYQEKMRRLKSRAEERVKGKEDVPTKRPPVVRSGINTITSLIEQKKAQL
ncbi:hypothetical protein L5876_14595, partial [Hyphobacterium sp. SN044]|uniref:hypothetical protein n=1 Tax=Hyphobacterium sp. SN044 TaxID=2912575 RepID=UPI001F37F3D7